MKLAAVSLAGALFAGSAFAGCAKSFPLPMTRPQLVSYDSGPALVAYLGQRDATPGVCDMRSRGPHILVLDGEMRSALVDGLVEGTVDPELWRRCANALLRSAPANDVASLLDVVGRGYRKLIRREDLETSSVVQARLQAVQRFYIDRKNGYNGHSAVEEKLIAELRRALVKKRLGPVATRFGEGLVDIVDLEHGVWLGHPVDAATMDRLFAAREEKTLRRFANRLPSPELRDQAKRRVIRIHIAASQFSEVRDHAAEVEETLMKSGVNPIALGEHAPIRGWLDEKKLPMRGVLVRQQVWQRTATLLGYSGDPPGISVLPELKLRGALFVELQGLSHPVTLCGSAKELDPTPCVPEEAVQIENPVAYLDRRGAFHFVEHIAIDDAINLAQMRDRFVLPVSVAGRQLLAFSWRLYYERPSDLVFTGDAPGTNGPSLGISIDRRDPNRYIFNVSSPIGPYLAAVEAQDVGAFHIVSRCPARC